MGMPNMNMGGNMFNPNMNMNFQNMNMPNMMNMNMGNANMQNMMAMMMMMNNSNMNIPGMNVGGNEDWIKGYNLAMSEENNMNNGNKQQIPDNKINCVFKTTQGVVTNLLIDQGKTMSELIKTYLNRMGKPELFGKKDGVCFLFNASKVDFDCNIKVEDFFTFNGHPTLIVNDVNNLIGA